MVVRVIICVCFSRLFSICKAVLQKLKEQILDIDIWRYPVQIRLKTLFGEADTAGFLLRKLLCGSFPCFVQFFG